MSKIYHVLLFISVFCLSFIQSNAQGSFVWARGSGGGGGNNPVQDGYGVCTDISGNVIFVGMFMTSTIVFDTITLSTTDTLRGDIFIVKYNANGGVMWAKKAGGDDLDVAYSVSVDAGGNIYVAGGFASSTIYFNSYSLTNSGSLDAFIAKYDPNGNIIWASKGVGTNEDEALSVCCEANGNALLAGYFKSGTITFGSTNLVCTGGGNIFLVKYDPNGNVIWGKTSTGTGFDAASSISVQANGNIYLTGSFRNSSIVLGSNTLTPNAGNYDIFIAKYDLNGNEIWAKSAGGSDHDGPNSISVDANGNSYITGGFLSASATFGTITINNVGWSNVFIAKYDPFGNVIWAQSSGGPNFTMGYCVATDLLGDIYLCGDMGFPNADTITFGAFTLPPPVGYSDPMFLIKFDPSGNVLCGEALTSGGGGQNSICADRFGNAYIGGDFYAANPFVVGLDSLPLTTGPSGENAFVAKYYCGLQAIEEKNITEEIKIYPNPSSTIFNIQCAEEIKMLVVNDVMGNVILRTKPYQKTIDLSNLPQGIYFLSVKTEKGVAVKKIIKQ